MYNLVIGLKRVRKEKNILQKDIALFLGIPLRTYQSYEYGEALPNIDTLDKLADFFDISLDYLVGREPKDMNK
jgi:transcriptional regulator with XRE-family HTH domain